MIPYYVAFGISLLFCLLGEQSLRGSNKKNKQFEKDISDDGGKKRFHFRGANIIIASHFSKKNGIMRYHIFLPVSILVVTFLAGMRDYTVGTDVLTYGNSLFYYTQQYNPLPVFIERFSHIEPLYLVLVYISSLLSKEPHILYYLTGLLIYSFLMVAFIKKSDTFPLTLTWCAFLFLLYGDTYNAMRQCIAIAIGLWAFVCATKKEYIKFGIGVLGAFMFHNTAVMFIPIYLVYYVLQKNNKLFTKILIVVLVICGILFFNHILSLLMQIGLLNSKMERYYINENTGISFFAVLIRIPFLGLILLEKKRFINGKPGSFKSLKNENEADFYIIALMLELITVELSAFVASLYRISLYFVPFRCMAYARICGVQKKSSKYVLAICLLLYLLIIFIYQNQVKGNNDIYPYIFAF